MRKRISGIALWTGIMVLGAAALSFGQQMCPLKKNIKPKGVASLSVWESMAVLQDGRVKPVQSYAQIVLLQISGKRNFGKESASAWLARLLFAPDTMVDDKVFLINNPEIADALGVKPEPHRRYSFAQIQPGIDKLNELALKAQKIEAKSRTIVEEELLRLYANIQLFSGLSESFTFAFPDPDFSVPDPDVRRLLGLPENQEQNSYLDIASHAEMIAQASKFMENRPPQQWTSQEKAIAQLLNNMYDWSRYYHGLPFHNIPPMDGEKEGWLTSWEAATANFQDPKGREELQNLQDMVKAFWQGQQLQFDVAGRACSDSIRNRVTPSQKKNLDLVPLELFYNRLDLPFWSKTFYFLAFLVYLIAMMSGNRLGERTALGLVILGFVPHAATILMRIILLNRPPVSNLYETFLFVGFITAGVGLIIENVNRRGLGIVVSSICGFVFLSIAGKFAMEGDTLKMLVAVLNSNFWLSTHVLSITTGYAGVCVAGILGHLYILQGIFRPKDKALLETTHSNILGVLGFGLTMTFLGTNLGGIWADQSWGRFWGWDPKENGALLIVLWCAMIFHARMGKMIGPLGAAVASVLGIVVVMWAWFGVNLLSVGLHSYGFTSGVATGLFIYLALQVLFLTIAVPMFIRRVRG